MCGIFFFNKKNDLNLSSDIFSKNLEHRGPDFNKTYQDNDMEIGHTLLSIRDTIDKSIQPVTTLNERYIISFNGQIYNLHDLKIKFDLPKDLFLDTSVISLLCNKLGLEFIHEIDGMFALIIYDKLEKKVSCLRDNTGQKPLYYLYDGKNFIISSELTPILISLQKKITVKIDLNRHLNFISNWGSKTIYKDIFKVLPGQKIEFDLSNNKILISLFNHHFINKEISTQSLLNKTTQDHLQSNQKVVINLSGGIDSNIILHEALKKKKIEAVSTHFETDENFYNIDFLIARKVCKEYGVTFHENYITKQDYVDNFVKSFETLEEINGNINNPIYFLNYKFIKSKGFRTVITGDGGDEIFVGYEWLFYKKFKLFKMFPFIKKYFFDNSKFLQTSFYFNKVYKRYNSFTILNKYFNKKAILNKYLNLFKSSKYFDEFKKTNFSFLNDNLEVANLINNQYFWLSNEVFNRTDKFAMKHSLEARCPFSDYNLRGNIISRLTNENFTSKNSKKIVRDIYEDKLNSDIFSSKKGWTAPRGWILDKKLIEIILDILPDKELYQIKWNRIKSDIYEDNSLMLNRALYPIISLAIVLNKNNLLK